MAKNLIYEYILPGEPFLDNSSDWPSLGANRDNLEMFIHKPISGSKLIRVDGSLGNEGIALNYSIWRIGVMIPEEQTTNPEWYVPLKLLKECMRWIRTVGHQYWLGTASDMTRAMARGSIVESSGIFTNFGGYQTRFTVRPLTSEQWEWIGLQLVAGRSPAIPDLLLSDALMSFSDDDYLQTIIRLGVICELELNAFIEDLLTQHNQTVQALYDEKKQFSWKLKNVPGILGAENYQDHNREWAMELCKLYDLRGSAIHHARCEINGKEVDFQQASIFVFATMDFLEWTKIQRLKLRIQ